MLPSSPVTTPACNLITSLMLSTGKISNDSEVIATVGFVRSCLIRGFLSPCTTTASKVTSPGANLIFNVVVKPTLTETPFTVTFCVPI